MESEGQQRPPARREPPLNPPTHASEAGSDLRAEWALSLPQDLRRAHRQRILRPPRSPAVSGLTGPEPDLSPPASRSGTRHVEEGRGPHSEPHLYSLPAILGKSATEVSATTQAVINVIVQKRGKQHTLASIPLERLNILGNFNSLNCFKCHLQHGASHPPSFHTFNPPLGDQPLTKKREGESKIEKVCNFTLTFYLLFISPMVVSAIPEEFSETQM